MFHVGRVAYVSEILAGCTSPSYASAVISSQGSALSNLVVYKVACFYWKQGVPTRRGLATRQHHKEPGHNLTIKR
jgi:hypothetical protein